ncbi:MAG: hydrogenase 4 subunit F [Planctomycetes bacterium]|nr:hydrogenase 4 subunit F [Planctomycetota bacterium]
MTVSWLLWILLILPAAAGGICLLLRSARVVLLFVIAAVAGTSAVAAAAAWSVFAGRPIFAGAEWLYLDALSAYHLILLHAVFVLSSVYAFFYFTRERSSGPIRMRRFGSLWLGSLAAMSTVLISNNLGMVWVGIEASTLLTAFLICTHVSPSSLEATWKYLIMCSVGVAFAFIGTLLVAAAAAPAKLAASDVLLWTHLREAAGSLNPAILKTGFIFLLVGYGTKTGLAPMHNWLPDAHSQAPAPVSAIFSGFLLNTALYCILRYVPLVEIATGGSRWALELLTGFGALSIVIAGAFIIFQHDAKRLLAYHSVEHMGIIALGVGLGGFGTFAAMFHVMNHSLCKSLGFFSAGRLGQLYGTHDLGRMAGAARSSPVWGRGFLLSLLALIGAAPFAIFMSEFQILKAAADRGAFVVMAIFLAGAAIVFVGALRHAVGVAWDDPVGQPAPENAGLGEKLLVIVPLAILLVFGLWMPDCLKDVLNRAADVIRGGL